MQKINKSAEILAYISKKRVIGLSDLAGARELLNLYSSTEAAPGLARRRIIDTVALLARQGFISVGTIDGEKIYKLNLKGKRHLESYLIVKQGITKTARWDGKWHLVTFDIPEPKKIARNNLIIHLKNQGLVNYTKGLWLTPYSPTSFVRGLTKQLGIEKQVKLITATTIDDEKRWRKHFGLA